MLHASICHAFQHGFNLRNLLTLEALDRLDRTLRRGEAAPDPDAPPEPGDGGPDAPFRVGPLPWTDVRDTGTSPPSAALTAALCARLWGIDVEQGWVRDGVLVGHDPGPYVVRPDRTWSGQRGLHFPQPPALAQDRMVGFPQ